MPLNNLPLVYYETGVTGTAGSITIATGVTNTDRTWKIKISYIECSNLARAPPGCVQYFTGTANTIMSYNFLGNLLLQGQDYENCIRQEEGEIEKIRIQSLRVKKIFSRYSQVTAASR